MATFQRGKLRSGQWYFETSYFYEAADATVAEVMAPRFFPKEAMPEKSMVVIRAADGLFLLWVSGKTLDGYPTFDFVQTSAPAPVAARKAA